MSTPTKYRSIFKGSEIDAILSSVKNKLDSTMIVNDYSGGTTKVASAEIVKTLYGNVQSLKDPNYFKSLFLSIPDSNIYSTAEKTKLAALSTKFVGSFSNYTNRNANVVTSSFVGGELAFVIDDGNGYPELSMWDNTKNQWTKTILYNLYPATNLTILSGTVSAITTLNASQYSTLKLVVTGKSGSNIQTQEIMITTNGTDDFISVYGEVGNSSTLFNITTSMIGSVIYINATTTTSSVNFYVKKTVEM